MHDSSLMTNNDRQKHGNIVVDIFKTLYSVVLSIVRSTCQSVMSVLWFCPGRYKDIRNEVILVTGGGKGIGRLIAVELAKHKPKRIVLWGRHTETLAATANVIKMMNIPCDVMVCDVSDRHQVSRCADLISQRFGGVTIVINNAGVVYGNTILNSDPEEMSKTLAVNTEAHFWTTRAFLPYMLRHNHGHLVFINSMLGLMGLGGAADYSCSKHAAAGFTESLTMEIMQEGKDNVHVTSVHPFMIDNDMFAGCRTRFPRLFPSLDPQYVAWKVVDAVLCNHQVVLIPRIMYLLYFVKSFLPMDAIAATHRFTGVDKTMDSFHGRVTKRN